MVRNGEIALSDVKRILRRYWWIPTFMTLTLGSLGLTASLVLPKKFTSSTVVLVERPTVPGELVHPVITDDLNQSMGSMKATILSRDHLEMIINKFNLYPDQRAKTHMEDLVEKLKSSISVELIQPLAGSADHQPPGFNVSVTYDSPLIAQQICQEITSAFLEQNANRHFDDSNKINQFLAQQLGEAKSKLDEQDRKLAQFKVEHAISTPDMQPQNLAMMSAMQSQLDATTQNLTRAQEDKSLNETLLSQQEGSWKAAQVGTQNPENQDQELQGLQEQLSALTAKYTPQHPDVIKLKAQIEDLKRRMAQTPAEKTPADNKPAALREPPAIQQLRAKIKGDDLVISDLTKRQAQVEDQIRGVQGRLQATPAVEEQLKEITRDHETASEIYNDLLKKSSAAGMATDLLHKQEGANFHVEDSPSLPSAPSFPKKSVFLGGGFAGGLALSLAILYLLALSDKAMYTERDIEVCLKLPVLVSVPSFEVLVQGNGHKLRKTPKYDAA